MNQYHFDLCLEIYAEDTLIVFAANLEDAWGQAVKYIKEHCGRKTDRILEQLRRADYAPVVHPAYEPIHFQYYE